MSVERGEPLPEFEELFRRHAAYVAAIAMKILGRAAEAEDVVQEVFIQAHERLRELRDPSAAKAWLATICVRMSRRRLKRAYLRRVFHFGPSLDYEQLVDPEASPEDRAHVSSVYRQLESLPADERIVWVLRYIEEEPLERMASLLGCSLSTVQRRLKRAQFKMEAVVSRG